MRLELGISQRPCGGIDLGPSVKIGFSDGQQLASPQTRRTAKACSATNARSIVGATIEASIGDHTHRRALAPGFEKSHLHTMISKGTGKREPDRPGPHDAHLGRR
jgi:hypothetical protein